MNYKKWFQENTFSLKGKKIALTGSTGGLGNETAKHLAFLGADLVLLNRNKQKTIFQIEEIKNDYDGVNVNFIKFDLFDIESVIAAGEKLIKEKIDVLILNAGVYNIKREETQDGFDKIFQANFVSSYVLAKKVASKLSNIKIVVVGSLAHKFAKFDECDIEYKNKDGCNKIYGNAKRFLMASMYHLKSENQNVELSIVHPGIVYTNFMDTYPKIIRPIVKFFMKILFMNTKTGSLPCIKGVFDCCNIEWIGPRVFNIWGKPKKRKLKSISIEEINKIGEIANKIYKNLDKNEKTT